jgi:hypothetical protein
MWKKCVISIMTEKDFWDKFNLKHNPKYFYAKKKTEKKKKKYRASRPEGYPIFKVSSRMD